MIQVFCLNSQFDDDDSREVPLKEATYISGSVVLALYLKRVHAIPERRSLHGRFGYSELKKAVPGLWICM